MEGCRQLLRWLITQLQGCWKLLRTLITPPEHERCMRDACSKLKDAYITLQENLNISILCEYMCITYCVLVRNFAYAYVMLRMYFYGKHLNLRLIVVSGQINQFIHKFKMRMKKWIDKGTEKNKQKYKIDRKIERWKDRKKKKRKKNI